MERNNRGKDGRKVISPERPLRAVVCVNQAAETTDRPDGTCLVMIPIRRPRWLVPPISWMLAFSSHRRMELDALGAEVLKLCDGKRSVEEIIENFAAKHKLSFREAQLSVGTFLKQLTQRGLVALVGKKEQGWT
jgi:hypothetical protein